MFENESYETVLNRMLSRFPSTFDKREGSIIRDLLSPKAIELAQAYMALDNVLNVVFPTTSYGEYLDRKVAERNIYRRSGKARGTVTFTAPLGTEIPIGTQVGTDDAEPILFISIETVIAESDRTSVEVEAVEIGIKGNVNVGAITNLYSDLASIASITNLEAFAGGIDQETDEELLKRYLDDVQKPSTSGNKYDYIRWAKSIPGIYDARVYALWNGVGTVKVVVINDRKRSPAQTVIDEVINYIESVRPILAEVTVEGVQEVPIDVSMRLTLKEGANVEVTRASLSQNVVQYFESMAFEETDDYKVRITAIGNAVLDATNVIDYSNLKINNVTANIALLETQVPVIGAINISTE